MRYLVILQVEYSDVCVFLTHYCCSLSFRKIETLHLEKSNFLVKDGEWIHQMALHNKSVRVLNFYLTPLNEVNTQDLETLASNCPSLVSLKMGLFDILKLKGFFKVARHLQEFYGSKFSDDDKKKAEDICLPQNLSGVGFYYMRGSELPLVFPFADKIQKLDLRFAWLSSAYQCELLRNTPNLEVLEVNVQTAYCNLVSGFALVSLVHLFLLQLNRIHLYICFYVICYSSA